MADLLYRVAKAIARNQLRVFGPCFVEGLESVPPMGPLIVVANHLSNLDGPLLGAVIPRRLRFIAKRGLFKPVGGRLLRTYGMYSMDNDGHNHEAFLWARKQLNQDRTVAIFPEAQRNPGGMEKVTLGAALIALKTQAAILPVGITGTERLAPLWRVLVPAGEVTVRIGQPFTLPDIRGRLGRAQLQSLGDMIMHRVAALLPVEYQGVYRLAPAQRPEASGAGV